MPPLSHSSASTLLECEQKYTHYKILKTPNDPDYEKSDALAIGSAFHWILEKSEHKKPRSITKDLAICVRDPTIGLSEDDIPLVHAMVVKYLRLHDKMKLRVIAVEIEIRTDWFLGYVDMVMEDDDGNWYLGDLKTWKSLSPGTIQQLPKDPQLALYCGHYEYVAELLDLVPEKFAGAIWRVVTKTSAKRKANEEYLDYVKRLADKHLTAYHIPVPKSMMDSGERLAAHFKLWEKTIGLRKDPTKAMKNFKGCFSYFSPCQYFSRCHGRPFSEPVQLETSNVRE
jgi:PD-(D/E)XK nuclease superfamily